MEIIFIAIPFLLIVAGIAYIVNSSRKRKKTMTKEERRSASVTAIIIFIILLLLAFLRQSIKQDRIDNVLEQSNTNQSSR